MGSNIRDGIRWAIAVMIVLVPIMSMIYSAVTRNPTSPCLQAWGSDIIILANFENHILAVEG